MLFRSVVDCIVKSFLKSNGHAVEAYTAPSDICDKHREMLQVVCVSPWDAPECPPLQIPEKPAVVLDVMCVGIDSVTAGIDDVFQPIIMVEHLEVDEELVVGDRIIVKAAKLDKRNNMLKDLNTMELPNMNAQCLLRMMYLH